ncbi:MAG: hypothetical protein ABJG68_07560 [Crocinitomicaceae bacterium]
MKKVFQFLAIIALTIFFVSATIPEEYKDQLKMAKESLNMDVLSISLDYNVYSATGTKIIDHSSGNYTKNKGAYFYQIENTKMIQDDKWSVFIDEADKLIVVNDKNKMTTQEFLSFDTAIEMCETIERFENTSSYTFSLTFKGYMAKEYKQAKITISKSNFIPQKVVFYYSNLTEYYTEKGESKKDYLRMEIKYSDIKYTSSIDCNTEKYFSYEKGSFQLKEAYRDYSIIDQRLHR